MLYVCPTPIGNLEDITLRVLAVLREVDVIACEDTRHTGNLLRRFEIRKELVSFFEHNEVRRLDLILGYLREGKQVALVSDAGMPALSDPGYSLVRACLDEDFAVTVLPGASSIPVALVASGLPTDRFTFVGFLPRGSAGKLIGFLEAAGAAGGTVVAFESPRRLRAALAAVAERWPERRVAVCRELTKLHEQVLRGTAADVAAGLSEPVRGEIVLVLEPDRAPAGGAAGGAVAEGALTAALDALVAHGFGSKEAAGLVASLTGMPQREAYQTAVKARQRRGPPIS